METPKLTPEQQKEANERRKKQLLHYHLDLGSLNRAQQIAHSYWLKTDTQEKRLWSIVGKKLQEAIGDTERCIRMIEKEAE